MHFEFYLGDGQSSPNRTLNKFCDTVEGCAESSVGRLQILSVVIDDLLNDDRREADLVGRTQRPGQQVRYLWPGERVVLEDGACVEHDVPGFESIVRDVVRRRFACQVPAS